MKSGKRKESIIIINAINMGFWKKIVMEIAKIICYNKTKFTK